MKTYDRICPVCGYLNRNMYLEETDGWMECEQCGRISQVNPMNKDGKQDNSRRELPDTPQFTSHIFIPAVHNADRIRAGI